MPLDAATPVYPGDPPVQVTEAGGFGTDGYLTHLLRMGSHNGTHLDAEAHMIPGGWVLTDYPIDQFVGSGILIDIRNGADPAEIDRLDIGGADAVLLRSGISDRYAGPDYYHQLPPISAQFAERLARRHPKLVGVDAGSIDGPPYPLHKLLLGAGVLLAENLVGLSTLAGTSFEVWALPLALGIEAAPARVLARLT